MFRVHWAHGSTPNRRRHDDRQCDCQKQHNQELAMDSHEDFGLPPLQKRGVTSTGRNPLPRTLEASPRKQAQSNWIDEVRITILRIADFRLQIADLRPSSRM